MHVVSYIIGMVKNNIKEFCKDTIENIKIYWQGNYYLVLRIKPMVPGVRPLIATGYK